MTRDDILRMTRESKLCYICGFNPESEFVFAGLKAFANLVAAAEREACARVCEAEANQWRGRDSDAYAAVWDCAHAILARGENYLTNKKA